MDFYIQYIHGAYCIFIPLFDSIRKCQISEKANVQQLFVTKCKFEGYDVQKFDAISANDSDDDDKDGDSSLSMSSILVVIDVDTIALL